MKPFCIALILVALSSYNVEFSGANDIQFIVNIHHKQSKKTKSRYVCSGSLINIAWVLTSRYCLAHRAYQIRYGDMSCEEDKATYSPIISKVYHPNSQHYIAWRGHSRLKPSVSGSNNIALAFVKEVPNIKLGILGGMDYTSFVGKEVEYYELRVKTSATTISKMRYRTKFKSLSVSKRKAASAGILSDKGIVSVCNSECGLGPYICVVGKCSVSSSSILCQSAVVPSLGSPLVYDQRIVGIAADLGIDHFEYTPVAPYLHWISNEINRWKILNVQKEVPVSKPTPFHSNISRHIILLDRKR